MPPRGAQLCTLLSGDPISSTTKTLATRDEIIWKTTDPKVSRASDFAGVRDSECSTGARLVRPGDPAVHSAGAGRLGLWTEGVLRSRGPHERVRPFVGSPRTSLDTLPKTQQERESISLCGLLWWEETIKVMATHPQVDGAYDSGSDM